MVMIPAPLTDQLKAHLAHKRSTHLKPSKQDNNVYLQNQPIWFTDDSLVEWKPWYIESKDTTYWIINDKSNRRLRRNKHDIKPRCTTIAQQRPQLQVPARYPANFPNDDPIPCAPTPSTLTEVPEPVLPATPLSVTPPIMAKVPPANSSKKAVPKKTPDGETIRTKPADSTPVLSRSWSRREIKPPRNPDFVYNCK